MTHLPRRARSELGGLDVEDAAGSAAILIHVNYLSQKDIEICLACGVSGVAEGPQQEPVAELHEVLSEEYGQDAD